MLGSGCPACGVVLLERTPNTDECVVEGPDRLEGIGAEEAEEEAIGGEGVVELEGNLLTGEPAHYSAVHLEAGHRGVWEQSPEGVVGLMGE